MDKFEYLSVDLFAGAGGMTEGFRALGFKPLFANDHEKPALETYQRNHKTAVVSSEPVESLDPEEIRNKLNIDRGALDVLLGGPPCQGFSTYGKRDPKDIRNQLYNYYIKFLDEFRPKTFVMENVVGMLSMGGGSVIDDIVSRISQLGYGVSVFTLDAVEFGVPQFRKRVFICGGAYGQKLTTPVPTHSVATNGKPKIAKSNGQRPLFLDRNLSMLRPAVTVREAISDLPDIALPPKQTHGSLPYPSERTISPFQQLMRKESEAVTHHSAKQMLGIRRLRLALMRPGDYGTKVRSQLLNHGLPADVIEELLGGRAGFRNLNDCRTEDRLKEEELRRILSEGHVDIELVLQTIDAGGFANKYRRLKWESPSHTLVAHMARDCSDFVHPEIDRFISVREAARLQSFPDTYYFTGSQFQQFRQIGNAVPPKLSEAVARVVADHLLISVQETVLSKKSTNESAPVLKSPM